MIAQVKVDLHPQLSEKGFPVGGWIGQMDGWMDGWKDGWSTGDQLGAGSHNPGGKNIDHHTSKWAAD